MNCQKLKISRTTATNSSILKTDQKRREDPSEKLYLPNVNPRAGETKREPKTEKAPETGNIADISPLMGADQLKNKAKAT